MNKSDVTEMEPPLERKPLSCSLATITLIFEVYLVRWGAWPVMVKEGAKMGSKFEHDELAFYVNNLDSMLQLEKFFPQKEGVARSYTMPYEDFYGETAGWYGTIQITEKFMVLIEFESPSVISFGLFQRRRVGEFPKEIFRKLIGRPVEDPHVERSKLLGIARMRVLAEMVEILQSALHDEETLTKLPEDFSQLRMPLIVGSQSIASYLDEAEAKLGRSDPKYGGLIFGIALWSAFLLLI